MTTLTVPCDCEPTAAVYLLDLEPGTALDLMEAADERGVTPDEMLMSLILGGLAALAPVGGPEGGR